MRYIKKCAAVMLAAVTALLICIIPAGAMSISDRGVLAESGTVYEKNLLLRKEYYYLVKLEEDGCLDVDIAFESYELKMHIYDEYGRELDWLYEYGDSSEDYIGVIKESIPLKKGTYYIMLERKWSKLGSGDVRFVFDYPDEPAVSVSEPDSSTKLSFMICMNKGDSIKLGTLIGGWYTEDVEFSNTDDSVAKLYKSGKLKALKEGQTVITATSAKEKILLTVIVL